MSTQQSDGIPFSITHDFTNFRLFELPNELLQLLTSSEPPILELKSEANSSNAVLCSQTQTFPIRSVHTSNSLFIIQPALQQSANDDESSRDGIQAIASCGSTMELTISRESALPFLQRILPIYSSRDLNIPTSTHTSFQSISRDIPLSDMEIESAWWQLCAFEEHGTCFRPTAAVLLELWKAIVTAAVAERMDLGSSFLIEDLWAAMQDEEFPRGLFHAVLRRIGDQNSKPVDTGSVWLTVDKRRCSAWVASLILETGDQTLPVTDFLDTWRNNLFESWQDIPSLDVVQDICSLPTPKTVSLRPEHRLAGVPVMVLEAAEAKASIRGGRKWHEKFKNSRA